MLFLLSKPSSSFFSSLDLDIEPSDLDLEEDSEEELDFLFLRSLLLL